MANLAKKRVTRKLITVVNRETLNLILFVLWLINNY